MVPRKNTSKREAAIMPTIHNPFKFKFPRFAATVRPATAACYAVRRAGDFLLSMVATVITLLPYTRPSSLLVDKIIDYLDKRHAG